MDKAVGSKIADYLIKPVNPNQVLLSIKKNVHQQQLVTEQTTADYRSEFGRISSSLQMAETFSGLVLALPQAHQLGGRAFGIHRPGHQGGADLPEDRGEPGVLQVRAPQLLQLDQQALGRHPRDVAHAHAHQHLPGGGREPEDHAAADRQLPLRPVAVDLVAAAGLLRRGAGRFLLRHPPHGHAIRPQRRLRRPDAAGHRQADAQQVAQRQRGRRQEPVRGGVPQTADEPRTGKTGNSRSTSSCARNRAAGWSTIYKKCTTPISR